MQPKSSKYVGVGWHKRGRKWSSWISHKNRTVWCGTFETAVDAARARDRIARYLGCRKAQLNFPRTRLKPAPPALFLSRRPKNNRYIGVRKCPYRSTTAWAARLQINRRSLHLGQWRTEQEAAHARDRAALYYIGPDAKLNFPNGCRLRPAPDRELQKEAWLPHKENASSRFHGVCRVGKYWRATVWHNGRMHFVGDFAIEKEAAYAYDAAAVKLRRGRARLNFP